MSTEATQLRREECRREVRRYLAERCALAFPVTAIRRKLRIDGDDFSEEEIEAALALLISLNPAQVALCEDELGSSKNYQITAAGVLAHERRR